jgi:uncharacterized protein (DUF488 family)
VTSAVAGGGRLRDDLCVPARIYSVGYEGFELKGLIETLVAANVSLVVDVRLTPRSRKPGFSAKPLSAELGKAGIAYRHEVDLGNPADNRDAFRRGDAEEGRHRLRWLLSNGAGPALERLVQDSRKGHVAVLCVERSPLRCHREVVTDMAREIDPTIEVRPIL